MRKFGLIGYPLSHSFSKDYFTEKFRKEGIGDCSYENFPLPDVNELPQLLKSHPGLVGLNVTIPYKESVIPLLDTLQGEAHKIGAVNTIKISKGKKMGYNTDAHGFRKALLACLKPFHNKALILGSGGAAKAVGFVLENLQIPYLVVSRKPGDRPRISYEEVTGNLLSQYTLLINTTPLGMFPEVDTCPPLPYEAITPKHLLFDLVYNPQVTKFLQRGKAQGATTCNGMSMLIHQAEKSWEIWNS